MDSLVAAAPNVIGKPASVGFVPAKVIAVDVAGPLNSRSNKATSSILIVTKCEATSVSCAKEALAAADTHYSKLVSRTYEVIDEASMTNNLSAKTAGIKLVMDIESKRIDMLQKAGLLENKELAEEMMEIERRQEVLVSILKDIASEYPQIRDEIMRRLSSFAKDNEVITVVHDVQ